MHGLKRGKEAAVAALLVIAMTITGFPAVCGSAASTENKSDNLSDSLVLHYTFDDEDNLGHDSSGNGNDGTVSGNVSCEEGRIGKAAKFDSTSHKNSEAYISMPKTKFRMSEFTIMTWAKFDIKTVGKYSRIFELETSSSSQAFLLMTNAGTEVGGYKFEMYGGSPANTKMATEGLVPTSFYSDWHHIAVSYDSHTVKFYVNGALISEVAVEGDLSKWRITHAFLGKTATWGDGTYNGLLDDVRVYSKALTESEICGIVDFSDETSKSSIKLLSSLSVDGKELEEFDAFTDSYYKVYDSSVTAVPKVSAEAPFSDAKVSVKQASAIPGTATVTVTYKTGEKRTVKVSFIKRSDAVRPETDDVTIDDEFWNDKLKMYSEVSAPYIIENWVTKHFSNFVNFDNVAKGDRNTQNYVGSMTWGECEMYAALAGACRIYKYYPNTKLLNKINECVDHIFAASESVENGYFSIYNLLMTDGKVFSETSNPAAATDLYNLGYLIEFGIAYYNATGDARMLRVALRFLNFTVNYSNHGKVNIVSYYTTVEYNIIALCEWLEKNPDVKNDSLLKDLTINEDDYIELCENLLSYRGVHTNPDRVGGVYYGTYGCDHVTYKQLTRATGHAVNAALYYTALSETGRYTDDVTYTDAAVRLWNNIVDKQMYVTGGIGAVYSFEGFGGDYYLPNESYCESCASGSLIQMSDSLSQMFADAKYADNIELELYNNLLGSIGENGTTFFYQNPLYTTTAERYTWHGVPCCTKYGLLIYGQLGRYIYSYRNNDIYVDQYIGSAATLRLPKGNAVLKQTSDWQWNGKSTIKIESGASNIGMLYLRIPSWSSKTSVTVNGKSVKYTAVNGYAAISGGFSDGDTIVIQAKVEATRIYADENVEADIGKTAIRRGVFIYCIEDADNKSDITSNAISGIVLEKSAKLGEKKITNLYGGVVAVTAKAKFYINSEDSVDYTLTAIPFYARANRGANALTVWIPESADAVSDLPVKIPSEYKELKTLGAKFTGITNGLYPQGAGSRDISIIVDGKTTFSNDSEQYDTYLATFSDELGQSGYQWFGVQFDKEYVVSHILFYEGGHWNEGGWFGSVPYVQAKINGKWTTVKATMTPDYPGDSYSEQFPSNETYTFILDTPTECSAVRIVGYKNSLAGNASCVEIEVYGKNTADKIPSAAKELRTLGTKYKAVTNGKNPQGGGSRNISIIADGKTTFSNNAEQYDTYLATFSDELGKNGYQWFGVEFTEGSYAVSNILFYEGGHWTEGGWFGSIPYVQLKINGEWVTVKASMSPEYPGDSYSEQLPDNEVYTFTLESPTVCSGVRVVGYKNSRAGNASCVEIEVYGAKAGEADKLIVTTETKKETSVPETSKGGPETTTGSPVSEPETEDKKVDSDKLPETAKNPETDKTAETGKPDKSDGGGQNSDSGGRGGENTPVTTADKDGQKSGGTGAAKIAAAVAIALTAAVAISAILILIIKKKKNSDRQ
jgi:uncharacterized protein